MDDRDRGSRFLSSVFSRKVAMDLVTWLNGVMATHYPVEVKLGVQVPFRSLAQRIGN